MEVKHNCVHILLDMQYVGVSRMYQYIDVYDAVIRAINEIKQL